MHIIKEVDFPKPPEGPAEFKEKDRKEEVFNKDACLPPPEEGITIVPKQTC